MSATKGTQRLHPRVVVRLAARFNLGWEATILDLSVGGVRLEHHGALRPGGECNLRFALEDQFYLFCAEVIWSKAIPPHACGGEMRFHTGVAFTRLPQAAEPLLTALVAAQASD